MASKAKSKSKAKAKTRPKPKAKAKSEPKAEQVLTGPTPTGQHLDLDDGTIPTQ